VEGKIEMLYGVARSLGIVSRVRWSAGNFKASSRLIFALTPAPCLRDKIFTQPIIMSPKHSSHFSARSFDLRQSVILEIMFSKAKESLSVRGANMRNINLFECSPYPLSRISPKRSGESFCCCCHGERNQCHR
jgi:hypothetical protein